MLLIGYGLDGLMGLRWRREEAIIDKGDERVRNRIFFLAVAVLVLLNLAGMASASSIISHTGANDPVTENFERWPWSGGMAVGPVLDDNGRAAWQVTDTGFPQQAIYNQQTLPGGGALNQEQIIDINTNGFVLSLEARIVQGPEYDVNGSQQPSAAIVASWFPGTRFDIALGLDESGNTLVILPDFIYMEGGGTSIGYNSHNTPLVIPGNDYHLYQLSYDPASRSASFFLDGVFQLTGYMGASPGAGIVTGNLGLAFGSLNSGSTNFSLAELETGQLSAVPEPSTMLLIVSGLAGLMGLRRRSCN